LLLPVAYIMKVGLVGKNLFGADLTILKNEGLMNWVVVVLASITVNEDGSSVLIIQF